MSAKECGAVGGGGGIGKRRKAVTDKDFASDDNAAPETLLACVSDE